MNRSILCFVLGLAAGASLLAGVAISQEKDVHAKYAREMPDMSPEGQQKLMQDWIKLMTPGKYQERLSYFIGEWTTETTMTMPGAEPMKSPGKASFRWLLPNRYVFQEWEAPIMGMPAKGFVVTGYDNFRREYVSAIGTSMETTISLARGYIDLTGKKITQYATMDEPGLNMIGKPVKYVTRIVDADHFVFEIHDVDLADGGGGDPVVISVAYTRKK